MLAQMDRVEFLTHWPAFIGDIGWEHFQFVLNRSTQESQVKIHYQLQNLILEILLSKLIKLESGVLTLEYNGD